MDNLIVKAVITNIYCTKPIWVNEDIEIKCLVTLDSETNDNDISLFFGLLFEYNEIDYGSNINEALDNLLSNDEIIISGGPFFTDGLVHILPSCCCGLEGLNEVTMAIKHNVSPWLGHDPNPGIEYYSSGNVKIWGDDPVKNDKVEFILCTYRELIIKWVQMCEELLIFFDKSCLEYLKKYSYKKADKVILHLKKSFNINVL